MLHLNRYENLRWSDEDYIYENMYTYDQKRVEKHQIESLVCYFFDEILEESENYVSIDEFTDWLHELTDEEISKIFQKERL